MKRDVPADRRGARRLGRHRRDGRRDVFGDAGRYGEVDPARGHVPPQRAGVGLRPDPGRHGRVLLVRQRARRRQRPQDQLQVRRRRLQPGEHRADHAQVRRAGSCVRARRRSRHRAADSGAPVPEPEQGAAALRLHRRDDVRPRLLARTRGRSAGSPTTRRKARSTASTSRKNLPTAKLGILYQNDDYGNDYLRGLKAGLTAQHQPQIVDAERYALSADAAGDAGGEAEGLGRGHVRDLRDADADDPGVRHRRRSSAGTRRT